MDIVLEKLYNEKIGVSNIYQYISLYFSILIAAGSYLHSPTLSLAIFFHFRNYHRAGELPKHNCYIGKKAPTRPLKAIYLRNDLGKDLGSSAPNFLQDLRSVIFQ